MITWYGFSFPYSFQSRMPGNYPTWDLQTQSCRFTYKTTLTFWWKQREEKQQQTNKNINFNHNNHFYHENLYEGRYFMAVMRHFTYKRLRCLHSCSTFAAPSIACSNSLHTKFPFFLYFKHPEKQNIKIPCVL